MDDDGALTAAAAGVAHDCDRVTGTGGADLLFSSVRDDTEGHARTLAGANANAKRECPRQHQGPQQQCPHPPQHPPQHHHQRQQHGHQQGEG